jgi:hypothetical protein
MAINLNAAPYYDDFDASKNYHKILFMPDRPVQSRELTQIQSIIQEQIKKHGDFMFQNGAMIVPGNISIESNIAFLKLDNIYNGLSVDNYLSQFQGKNIIGKTTGVKARVYHFDISTLDEPPVIFVSYSSGSQDVNDPSIFYNKFLPEEELQIENSQTTVKLVKDEYTGKGSLAQIQNGIYYMNGYFIQVSEQIISLDKFGSTPSFQVGLTYTEEIVTVAEDVTLFNNANGFYNDTAPGADRLKVTLVLSKYDYFSPTDTFDFISLLSVKDGIVQSKTNTTKLNKMGDILARRTQNDAGDYITTPFNYLVNCLRSNNRGDWASNTAYITGDVISFLLNNYVKYAVALNSGNSGVLKPSVEYGDFVDGDVNWLVVDNPQYHGATQTEGTLEEHQEATKIGNVIVSSGKAYVAGYEIDLSQGQRVIEMNKATEVGSPKSIKMDPLTGKYFIVDTVRGIPQLNGLATLTNNNAVTTGSCRIRSVESIGNNQYKVYVFDVNMTGSFLFARDAQKVVASGFSANIVGTRKRLSGNVSNTSGSGAISGNGTLFTLDLSVGDSVVIGSTVHRVETITDSVAMTVLPVVSATNSNISLLKEESALSGNDTLVQELPNIAIKEINTSKTSYFVRRLYQVTAQNGAIVLNVATGREAFASIHPELHLVAKTDGSEAIVSGLNIFITGLENNQLKISGLTSGISYRVLTTIKKVSVQAKQKVRKFKTVELNTLSSVDKATLVLNEADVSRVVMIKQSNNTFDYDNRSAVVDYESLGESTITQYYKLNQNISNSYYGISTIVAVGGFVPSAPIRITYEYYDHGEGDFFSVDSYASTLYSMIPYWQGKSYADLLDFRPRVSDDGLGFTGAGSSITEPLSSIHPIDIEYTYYLPRRDIIELDSKGNFRIEEGTSSLTPVAPLANDGCIILAYLDHPANCTNPENVLITQVPLKAYTMKDIGSLDRRLTNTEYNTSLTTSNDVMSSMQVTDEYGLNRYKSGLVIDQFNSHVVGNVTNPDYKCAIDGTQGICRPAFNVEDVKLIESAGVVRSNNHYTVTGDLVTLPYTSSILFQNLNATTPENVTPYTHLRYAVGSVSLFPSYDTWIDSETLPTVNSQSEGSFASIVSAATSLNVLGTFWNSWQEASRATISTNTTTLFSSTATDTTRTDTTTTVVNGVDSVSQTRTGTVSVAQERWDELGRVTGVQDQGWQPFARSRAIVLYGRNFMPLVQLYAFMNEYNVTGYVTPSQTIVVSSKVGNFSDYKTSSISQGDLTARQFGSNDYDILDKGEVVCGMISGATAITVAQDTSTILRVLNVKGTFANGETIRGLTTGATAVFGSIAQNPLATNSNGSFYGLLMVPNNDQIKIPSQLTTVTLKDSLDNNMSTRSSAIYNPQGLVTQRGTTILSVKNANIITRSVDEARTVQENWTTRSSTSTTSITNCNCDCGGGGGDGGGGDPLAQSFTSNDKGGVFITKLELFFHSVNQDPTSSVFVQIREMVNGYPGAKVVPMSTIHKFPHEITAMSATSLVPTTFTFESPIFLLPNVEYCVVVGANFDYTNDTKIWTSQLGVVSLDGQMIFKQPLMGSMFKSQNSTTWNAFQLSDLCVKIYKADFDTSRYGHVSLNNVSINSSLMMSDPFKTVTGSKVVRVLHNNHGLVDNDWVFFSGSNVAALNDQFVVYNTTLDGFTITLQTTATTTAWVGGNAIRILCNKKIDTLFLNGEDMVIPDTHINYTYRTTAADRSMAALDYPVQIKRNIDMSAPQYVLSNTNEVQYLGKKSVQVDAFLYSNNPNVSPVIDLSTYSLRVVANRVSNVTSAINLPVDKVKLINNASVSGGVVFSNTGTITITDTNYFTVFDAIVVGRYIQFTGTTSNNNAVLVTGKTKGVSSYVVATSDAIVNETISTAITLEQSDMFVDSIAVGTSNLANYISPIMTLNKVSAAFRLLFDYNVPTQADIKVFYKVCLTNSDDTIESKNWTPLNETFNTTTNPSLFTEKMIDVEVITYDKIMIKVEMRSINTSQVPKIKQLRLISLA